MATFHEARESLLLAYSADILDAEEFALLLDINKH